MNLFSTGKPNHDEGQHPNPAPADFLKQTVSKSFKVLARERISESRFCWRRSGLLLKKNWKNRQFLTLTSMLDYIYEPSVGNSSQNMND
jgi:hypothetical protein